MGQSVAHAEVSFTTGAAPVTPTLRAKARKVRVLIIHFWQIDIVAVRPNRSMKWMSQKF